MEFWIIFVVAFLFLISGVLVFYNQIVTDHSDTNLSDRYPWGLYVETFFFFSALGAGTLFVNALIIMSQLDQYDDMVKLNSIFSIGLFLAAGFVLSADLGKPLRALKMVTHFNSSSPLSWDFYLLAVCIVLNILFIFYLPYHKLFLIALAVITAISASSFILLHSLFLISKVESGFRSYPFLAMEGMIQALLGGTSVGNIVASMNGQNVSIYNEASLVLLILLLMSNTVSFISAAGTGEKLPIDRNSIGLTIINIFGLLFLIYIKPQGTILTLTVSLMILWSIFLKKCHFVRCFQQRSVIPNPYSQYDHKVLYKPAINEWLIVFGGIGLCIIIVQTLMVAL